MNIKGSYLKNCKLLKYMKIKLTLFLLIHSFLLLSQVQTKTQRVIKLIEPQSFYLNGGTKTMVGGNSRIGFKIDLPPNTIEWYYAFTTEPTKSQEQNIQLENQLRLLLSTTGISGNILNMIKIPAGQGLIDVFLTDRKGYDIFFKKDFFGMWEYTSPNHTIEGSRTNIKDGKVKIDDVKFGTHFLVIRNTSATTGVNVKLEVVAILEEVVTDLNVWDKKSKDLLFESLKTDVKKSFSYYENDKIEEITGCIMMKFTNKIKPSELNTLAEYEIKTLMKTLITECNF